MPSFTDYLFWKKKSMLTLTIMNVHETNEYHSIVTIIIIIVVVLIKCQIIMHIFIHIHV